MRTTMITPFRARIAAAVAVLAAAAALWLLRHPYVEGWELLDGILATLAVAAASVWLAGRFRRRAGGPRRKA